MKKYLIVPGYVKSKVDGDTHWIGAYELLHLYKVKASECIEWNRPLQLATNMTPMQYARHHKLTLLEPRYDGNYKIVSEILKWIGSHA